MLNELENMEGFSIPSPRMVFSSRCIMCKFHVFILQRCYFDHTSSRKMGQVSIPRIECSHKGIPLNGQMTFLLEIILIEVFMYMLSIGMDI